MRFEVFTAVKIWSVVLWVAGLCSLVGDYQRFEERNASVFGLEVTVAISTTVESRLSDIPFYPTCRVGTLHFVNSQLSM
jgi:hypothetical protein